MTRSEHLPLPVLIADAVGEYDTFRVLRATLMAALHRPTSLTEVRDLPSYLRRDVGLLDAEPPRPAPETLW